MNTNWQLFADYWPFLVPLIILEFGLMIAAVIHILRHQHYRFGNRLFVAVARDFHSDHWSDCVLCLWTGG